MSACSGKKMNFNGQYSCNGDGESLSCKIACPDGIEMDSPAADVYTCHYSTGQFLPQPIPQCVYGKAATSIFNPNCRDLDWTVVFSGDNVMVISNSSSSTFHIPGQVVSNSWEYGHGQVQVPDEISSIFNGEVKPVPGECSTWQGCHYKTFDGKLYRFVCRNCIWIGRILFYEDCNSESVLLQFCEWLFLHAGTGQSWG